jgi:hypothetical protein
MLPRIPRNQPIPHRLLILVLALLLALPVQARASDPLLTVAKNTLLGGITGLVLGATLTLVVKEDARSDVVRWGVVAGTFAGLGVGIYVASRGEDDLFSGGYPQSFSLRDSDTDPRTLRWQDDVDPSAEADAAVTSGLEKPGTTWAVRVPLLSLSW